MLSIEEQKIIVGKVDLSNIDKYNIEKVKSIFQNAILTVNDTVKYLLIHTVSKIVIDSMGMVRLYYIKNGKEVLMGMWR